MPILDQSVTWARVEERLAEEVDPVVRRNLETVLAHMKAEAVGDVEGILATLSEDVAYHLYGTSDAAANPVGKDQVQAFYGNMVASGTHRLHFDIERLVADRECVLTEGVMRMAYPGRLLQAQGIEIDDPDASYLWEARLAVLWPMSEDGRAKGEDTYMSGDGFAGIAERKLRDEDIAYVTP